MCAGVHTNPKRDFPKMRTISSPQEAQRIERKLKPSVASYPNLPPCLPFVSSLARNPRLCLHTPLRPPGPLQAPFPLHLFLAVLVQRRGTGSLLLRWCTSGVSQGLLEGQDWAGEGGLESLALQPHIAEHMCDRAGRRGSLPTMTTPKPWATSTIFRSSFNLM